VATRSSSRRRCVCLARRELRHTIERVSPEAAKPEEPVVPQD